MSRKTPIGDLPFRVNTITKILTRINRNAQANRFVQSMDILCDRSTQRVTSNEMSFSFILIQNLAHLVGRVQVPGCKVLCSRIQSPISIQVGKRRCAREYRHNMRFSDPNLHFILIKLQFQVFEFRWSIVIV